EIGLAGGRYSVTLTEITAGGVRGGRTQAVCAHVVVEQFALVPLAVAVLVAVSDPIEFLISRPPPTRDEGRAILEPAVKRLEAWQIVCRLNVGAYRLLSLDQLPGPAVAALINDAVLVVIAVVG